MRISRVSAGLTLTVARLTRALVVVVPPLSWPFSIEDAVCSHADAFVTGSVDPQSQLPSTPTSASSGRDGSEGGGAEGGGADDDAIDADDIDGDGISVEGVAVSPFP